MTTSVETSTLNHAVLRQLIDAANALPVPDRIALLKGLMPGVTREITPRAFTALIAVLLLKGERMYDAMSHPGKGRDTRQVLGEREIECR